MQLPGTHPPEMTKLSYEKWLHNNNHTQIAICLWDKGIVPSYNNLGVSIWAGLWNVEIQSDVVFPQERNSKSKTSLMGSEHRAFPVVRGFKLIWSEKFEVWWRKQEGKDRYIKARLWRVLNDGLRSSAVTLSNGKAGWLEIAENQTQSCTLCGSTWDFSVSHSWAHYELALSLYIKRRMDYGKEYHPKRKEQK